MKRKTATYKDKILNPIKISVKQCSPMNKIAPHVIRFWSLYSRQMSYAIDNDRYC